MLKSMKETRWHSFPTPNNEAAGGCDRAQLDRAGIKQDPGDDWQREGWFSAEESVGARATFQNLELIAVELNGVATAAKR